VGLTTLPCKKENCLEASRNSTGFYGGGQGLSWAVETRKEERRRRRSILLKFEGDSKSICKYFSPRFIFVNV
jgi:hypothetical protein